MRGDAAAGRRLRAGRTAPASRIAPNSRCETSARPRAPSIETRETWSTNDAANRRLVVTQLDRCRLAVLGTRGDSLDRPRLRRRFQRARAPLNHRPGMRGLECCGRKWGCIFDARRHRGGMEDLPPPLRRDLRGWPGVEDVWQRVVRRIVGMKTNLGSARRALRAEKPVRSPRHTLEIRSGASGTRRGSAVYTPSTFFHIDRKREASRGLAGGSVVARKQR